MATELEKMQRAKMILDKLADGIDPFNDMELPEDTVLNNVRLSRCLFYVAEILGKVIQNGGEVNARGESKARFFLTDEQKSQVSVSAEPIGINDFAKRINAVINTNSMTGISGVKINDWLLSDGYLTEITVHDKKMRVSTPKGNTARIATIDVTTPDGKSFRKNVFNVAMQSFILDNINRVNEVSKNDTADSN